MTRSSPEESVNTAVGVASDQKPGISRPVCWTAAGPMLSLEGWKPTTSSASGFSANSG